MSITITMQFADAQAVVDFFAGKAAVQTARTEPQAEKPAGKPAKPAKEQPAASPSAPAASAPAPAQPSAPAPAQPSAPAPAKPAGDAIPYTVLQQAVFALAAKNKDRVMALIAEQGGRNFKELPAEEWPAALKRVQAAQAEIDAASAMA